MKYYIAFGATTLFGIVALVYLINFNFGNEPFLAERMVREMVYEDASFDSMYLTPLITIDGKEIVVFPEIKIKGNIDEPNENIRR